MIKSDKKLDILKEILNNNNNLLITESIDLLRDERPFEGAISLLTSYYNKTDDRQICRSIERFMNDLKDQDAAEEVISEIKKQWKAKTISMLVSSCWQSGLDYTKYITDLTEIFMDGDYVTAIECLTVIQESIHDLNDEQRAQIRKIVENKPLSGRKEKSELLNELNSVLDS